MSNRITAAFERMKEQITQRLARGTTTQAQIDKLSKTLDMSWEEYVLFQEVKSLATLHEKLTMEEGMAIYNILGEAGPDNFNSQPLHVKSVLTNVFAELVKWKMSL